MLGRDLAATAPADVDLVARPRAALDLTRAAALAAALDAARPDVVLNAAAYTQVDRAEAEPAAAFATNAGAVGTLGALCAARGVRVVHVSTDYVFDGTRRRPYREGDATNPLGVYGASKRAGERRLAGSGPRALVVRTQWLFGAHGRSFVRTMWERARRGESARVVADQYGAPTHTGELAAAIWALVARDVAGVVHVTNAGEATWFDVAARVYAAAGRPGGVTPCASAEYPTPARRPAYAVLDTGRARAAGIVMRPWQAAVDAWVTLQPRLA
ncbi:NAD(P)-dependent oxidoreductase [Gemmatimonadetes bacterium T265]|nr:NAD(P)-dependent oxidoreductase [Gemmatimonadetes bacterium T265]